MASLALAFDILARDNASPTLRRVGAEADRTGTKVKGLGTSITSGMDGASRTVARFGSSFTAAAGIIAGAGIVRGIGAVVSAASDAEQSVGGVQAVFKNYASTVISDSRSADRALGLSANSYRELATVIGSQLKNAQVPLQEVAGQTKSIIGIGADLAAQFGGSTQDAVEALSSAFRGERDPIERYGISLTAASVGAKAVQMGLADSADDLSQNAKMMATLALITEQSADAQGAFGREADTSAGRAQRASAQWENLKVAIGDHLLPAWSAAMDFAGTTVLPVLGRVVDSVASLVGWFADLPGPIQIAVGAAGLWAVAGDKIVGAFGRLRDSGITKVFDDLRLRMMFAREQGEGFRGTVGAIGSAAGGVAKAGLGGLVSFLGGPWGVAFTAATAGITLLVEWLGRSDEATKRTTQATTDYKSALEAANGVINETTRQAAAKAAQDAGLLDVSERLGIALPTVTDAITNQGGALGQTREQLQAFIADHTTASGRSAQFGATLDSEGQKAQDALNALNRLSGQTVTTTKDQDQLSRATGAAGDAAEATVAQSDEAAEAVKKWREQLAGINDSFVEPLSVYKGLLDEKTAKERESAQATADATKSGKDSWKDYVGNVSVSLDEYATKLSEEITAQENWRTNLVKISQRGGTEVAQILSNMGKEGVDLTAQMASGTDAQFRRMADLLIKDAHMGGAGASKALDEEMKVMRAVGTRGSNQTAAEIGRQLDIGASRVAIILRKYGISIVSTMNPILQGLGKPHIALTTRGYGFNAGGGLAEGGYTGDGGKYEPKGIVHGGEFVFTKEQTRAAGVSNLYALAKRLGGYATGGLVALGRRLQAMGALVSEHPAFGGVSMGGHGATSLHYSGNAIDVNTRPGTSALEQRELAPMAALARSLGFRTIFMAPGHFNHLHVDTGGGGSLGMVTVNLPRPPSTAPMAPPLSNAPDAAMRHIYDVATAFAAGLGPATDTLTGGSPVVKEAVRAVAARYGWGTGAQWSALDHLIQGESGWNPNAANPTSSARGLFQKMTSIHGPLESTIAGQANWGLNYIRGAYGSPVTAYSRWLSRSPHWYDTGGWLEPGLTLAVNNTGRPERVSPPGGDEMRLTGTVRLDPRSGLIEFVDARLQRRDDGLARNTRSRQR